MARPSPLALVALLLVAPAARTDEFAQVSVQWIAPVRAERPQGEAIGALLTLPPGWAVGDAAVLLVAEQAATEPAFGALRAALLRQGAAVLELETRRMRGVDSAADGLLPWLFGSITAVQRVQGAGLVVAVGFGGAAEATLRSAGEEVAARHLGPGGSRLAAAAALGPEGPAYVLGRRPLPDEGWWVRTPLLCRMLAAAFAPGNEAAAERRCLAAVLPAG